MAVRCFRASAPLGSDGTKLLLQPIFFCNNPASSQRATIFVFVIVDALLFRITKKHLHFLLLCPYIKKHFAYQGVGAR